ncbi:MAG TPA: DNA polymerase/3'-5' exonuclease PolX [Tepidisphaeraceae bacterium]|nr:DNA polymerase/3'-5' exonuclease PolX [Tepidisphaeraceae bacterium]
MSLNHDLSDLFKTFAAVMEIKGESVFKAIAFTKVARVLNDMTFDIRTAVEQGTLDGIEGIGKSSRAIIEEFVRTGKSRDFEEVAATVPKGLIPMLDIPGLGPKTIALLWRERNITSVEELTKAIADGRLAGLKGVGDKKIEQISQGISLREQAGKRSGIGEAQLVAHAFLARIRALPGVAQADLAGSLRRRKETIGDLDIVASVTNLQAMESISQAFTRLDGVARVLGQGLTKASILTERNLQIDLRIVPHNHFGAAIQYFTGSKEHNVKLRGLALAKGLTLNEWGLYKAKEYEQAKKETGQPPELEPCASKTEADIYRALGLEYIEPELREDRGEIEAAAEGKLPVLITRADIRGDLHTHTTASDGVNTIAEMAEAAKRLGYKFLAITDHSKSQVVANGLTADRLLNHVEAIHKAAVNIEGIRLLAGCEVDILADGSLDFDESILKELDFVVASPHVALRQDREKATARIVRAIESRYVNVIGHPTGRLINQREGLPLDFSRIFAVAAATGTALEINSGYPRLDLTDTVARAAVEAGCVLSINTDAHSAEQLDGIFYGIQVARRAWVSPKDVINCMTTAQLDKFIKRKR